MKAKVRTRKVGYIHLALARDPGGGWVLAVERIDPFGGQPFRQDYWFEERANALEWFNMIQGNEDIYSLHRESDLPPIVDMPGSYPYPY